MNTNVQLSRTWRQCDILRPRLTNRHFGDYAGGDSVKWLIIKQHHEQLLSAATGNLKASLLQESCTSQNTAGTCHMFHTVPIQHALQITQANTPDTTGLQFHHPTAHKFTGRDAQDGLSRQHSSYSHAVPTFNTNCVYVWHSRPAGCVSASGSPSFIHSTLTILFTQFTHCLHISLPHVHPHPTPPPRRTCADKTHTPELIVGILNSVFFLIFKI